MFVRASYFKSKNYIKQEQWLDWWRESYGDQSITQVNVKAVKKQQAKRTQDADSSLQDYETDTLAGQGILGAIETVKYALKPIDVHKSKQWLLEADRQLTGVRTVDTGGEIRDRLRKVSPERLKQSHLERLGQQVMFVWQRDVDRYRKTANSQPD